MNIITEIRQQAIITPNSPAIACDERSYSYSQLIEIINGLSDMFAKNNIAQNDVVGIITCRSELSIFLYLTALNTGVIYIPIDETLPKERIRQICAEAKVHSLIMDDVRPDLVSIGLSSILKISLYDACSCTCKCSDYTSTEANPQAPAVILFTSGTTGVPKGVILPHECLYVSNKVDAQHNNITNEDNVLTVLNFCFAFSLLFLQPLIKGATLHIGTDKIRKDYISLSQYIETEKITVLTMPTQMGYAFCTNSTVPQSVRLIVVGGSAMPPVTPQRHFSITSVYGCSECLNAAFHVCAEESSQSILGIPNDFMRFRIECEDDDETSSGELIVSGPMVALGYVNASSSSKFFTENGVRWYRTGDKVQLLPNGEYKFIGRLDDMVKIDDHRIELAEIEYRMLKLDGIRQACVCAKPIRGKNALCAYYVSQSATADTLRHELSKVLPQYMIPLYFVPMENIPVNSSGKYDKSLLPIPKSKTTYFKEASNDKEKVVLECVSKVLSLNTKIGVNDNYRDLGGDSLNALMLVTELRERGYIVPADQVISASSFHELCHSLTPTDNLSQVSHATFQTSRFKSSSNLQSLLSYNTIEDINRFIIPEFFHCKARISLSIVNDVVRHLLSCHEMLRAVIVNDEYLIKPIDSHGLYLLREYNVDVNVSDAPYLLQPYIESLYAEIDICNGPLYAATLIHATDSDYILTAYSHIVSDNYTKLILRQDFTSALTQKIQGQEITLPQATSSYKSYCSLLNDNNVRQSLNTLLTKNHHADYQTIHIKFDNAFCNTFHLFESEHNIDVESFFSYVTIKSWEEVTESRQHSLIVYRHGRDCLIDNNLVSFDRTVGFFPICLEIDLTNQDLSAGITSVSAIKAQIAQPKKELLTKSKSGHHKSDALIGINFLGEDRDYLNTNNDFIESAPFIPKYRYTSESLNMYSPVTVFIQKSPDSLLLQMRYDTTNFSQKLIKDIMSSIKALSNKIIH